MHNGDVRYVFSRKKAAILRVFPDLTEATHGDEYYYSSLQLHLPWRNEESLLDSFGSAREAFMAKKESLRMNDSSFGEEVEAAVRRIEAIEAARRDLIREQIAPGAVVAGGEGIALTDPEHAMLDARNLGDDNVALAHPVAPQNGGGTDGVWCSCKMHCSDSRMMNTETN
jgi:hypothetical protein